MARAAGLRRLLGRPFVRVAAGLGLALATAAATVTASLAGPTPPPPPPGASVRPVDPADDGVLDLAGSGTNLPGIRRLARRFAAETGIPVRVHASVGSSGGVAALLDGVIDLALASRPLRGGERAAGLRAVAYAVTPVVVAVHTDVPARSLDAAGLAALLDGSRPTWSDGTPVVFVLREPGDSSVAVMTRAHPELARAIERARARGLHRVAVHDADVWPILESMPGAAAIVAEGDLGRHPDVRAVPFEGHRPTVAAVATGRYPYRKRLFVVLPPRPTPAARRFAAYVTTPTARAVLREEGYAPPIPARPPTAP